MQIESDELLLSKTLYYPKNFHHIFFRYYQITLLIVVYQICLSLYVFFRVTPWQATGAKNHGNQASKVFVGPPLLRDNGVCLCDSSVRILLEETNVVCVTHVPFVPTRQILWPAFQCPSTRRPSPYVRGYPLALQCLIVLSDPWILIEES